MKINDSSDTSDTNSKSQPQLELAAYIGLDWADKKHDGALWVPGSDTIERFTLAHTPEALAEWIAALRVRFGGQPVGICLEQSRGPLAHALWHYDHLVLYPVNPKMVARFRETLRPSGKKDDPLDSQLALEILRSFRAHLRPWVAADPLTRQLAMLVEDRRHLVNEHTPAWSQKSTSSFNVCIGLPRNAAHRSAPIPRRNGAREPSVHGPRSRDGFVRSDFRACVAFSFVLWLPTLPQARPRSHAQPMRVKIGVANQKSVVALNPWVVKSSVIGTQLAMHRTYTSRQSQYLAFIHHYTTLHDFVRPEVNPLPLVVPVCRAANAVEL